MKAAIVRPLFASAILVSFATPAVAQVEVTAGAVQLEFSGRLQFQLETTTCTDAAPAAASPCSSDEPALNMFLRRGRFSIEAEIEERLTFKVEPDFADVDGVALKDAYGRYEFSEGAALKMGHFNRPFDGFFLTSSSRLPFEREVKIPGVSGGALPSYSGLSKSFDLADRDIGFMLEGTPGAGPVSYALGVFTGGSASKEEDTNTEKQFIGRVSVDLETGGYPLELAGAIALTDAPYTGTDGGLEGEYFTNFEIFAELGGYDDAGLLVQAGAIFGDNPRLNELGGAIDLASMEDFASMRALQGAAAYRMAVDDAAWLDAVAPFVRISHADAFTDGDDTAVLGLTPGVVVYFHERNWLSLGWDIVSYSADGIDGQSSFKALMQFHF